MPDITKIVGASHQRIKKFTRFAAHTRSADMKKIDKLILKPFFRMMALTFCVILFVLLMQFFLIYFDDLVGKGLGWGVYLQLSSYLLMSAAREAFPLAIVLSSIIALGSLGEHFELTALKSAGISLPRVLRPLVLTVSLLSIFVLLFGSYLVPRANLKLINLLYDLSRKKPTLSIKEGIFYDGIPGYSIKVSKKLPDQQTLQGIMIYDHTEDKGNTSLATAHTGKLYTILGESYLVLELFDGYNYLEKPAKKAQQDDSTPPIPQFYRSSFKKQKLIISLASFKLSRTKQELFANLTKTKNIQKLNAEAKEKRLEIQETKQRLTQDFQQHLLLRLQPPPEATTPTPDAANILHLKAYLTQKAPPPDLTRTDLLQITHKALTQAKDFDKALNTQADELHRLQRKVYDYELEKHKMIAIAINCLIVLLSAAPLGALVKKKGLSMPIVIAVVLTVVYYVISGTAEKWAIAGYISPFWGAWIGNVAILPFGLFFLYHAYRDSRLLEVDLLALLLPGRRRKARKKLDATAPS